jgi:hypothetical protein
MRVISAWAISLFCLAVFPGFSVGQQLADAPSATRAAFAAKPTPHIADTEYAIISADTEPLPKAKHPSFWSPHPRRNFWIAHGALLASTVYDEEVTHQGLAHHKCIERTVDPPYPTRAQLYENGLAFDALVTGFDYLLYRTAGHGSQYAGAAVGIIVHVHGATQWFTEGCF